MYLKNKQKEAKNLCRSQYSFAKLISSHHKIFLQQSVCQVEFSQKIVRWFLNAFFISIVLCFRCAINFLVYRAAEPVICLFCTVNTKLNWLTLNHYWKIATILGFVSKELYEEWIQPSKYPNTFTLWENIKKTISADNFNIEKQVWHRLRTRNHFWPSSGTVWKHESKAGPWSARQKLIYGFF